MIASDPEARDRLARTYNDHGIERAVKAVTTCLQTEMPNDVRGRDLDGISRAVLAWLVGEPLRRASLGLESPYSATDEAVAQRVGDCIEMFAPLLFS